MELKIHGREKVWTFALEIDDDASATIVFPKYGFPRGLGSDLKEAIRDMTDLCRAWLRYDEEGAFDSDNSDLVERFGEIRALAEDIVYAWEKKFGHEED